VPTARGGSGLVVSRGKLLADRLSEGEEEEGVVRPSKATVEPIAAALGFGCSAGHARRPFFTSSTYPGWGRAITEGKRPRGSTRCAVCEWAKGEKRKRIARAPV
jgi:hypothetical protein